MYKTFQNLLNISFFITLIFAGTVFVNAQIPPPPPPPPVGAKSKPKIPGATVRGRVVFEDSGLPVRHTYIGLMGTQARSTYSAKFTKTDENGEFILTDVKAGSYYPYIKNESVINPDSVATLNQFDMDSPLVKDVFQEISVSGQGVFQAFISAKRGSSAMGTIRFFDGEVAANVNVEVLRKLGDRFMTYPVEKVTTDDRGFYRFLGLPDGTYTVRVTEPIPHANEQTTYISSYNMTESKMLKTYYPNVKTSRDASEFQLYAGQEATSIDITLPSRELFDVSGKVILKSTGELLKGYTITFNKIIDDKEKDNVLNNVRIYSSENPAVKTETGDWNIQNLPAGKYNVIASQTRIYTEKGKKAKKYPSVAKEVEIEGSNLNNIVLEVTEGGTIKGIILSENGKKFSKYTRVVAQDVDKNSRVVSEIDFSNIDQKIQEFAQMPFTINRLGAGKVKLGMLGRDFYIRSISIGSRTIGTDETIEIKPGETVSNVRIVLANDMGTVKGRVSNYSPEIGRAAVFLLKEGVSIIEPSSDGVYIGNIQQNGEFVVRAKPGRYKVIVISQRNTPRSREEAVNYFKELLENAQSVSVEKNTTTTVNPSLPD